VEIIWHKTILDTHFYDTLQEALHRQVHHRPASDRTEKEVHAKSIRLATTQALYRLYFNEDCLAMSKESEELGGSIQICCECVDGQDLRFHTTTRTSVSEILWQLVPESQLSKAQILWKGTELKLHHTLGDYGIKDQDTVKVHWEFHVVC
jgi:hypothetical protein